MNKDKIIFWSATSVIFLLEGVMPALTSQTEMAKQGIAHLGYPEYFGVALAVAKVLGAVSVTLPFIPAKIKEWAYAGLAFDFVFAFVSHAVVDGFVPETFFPIVVLAILMTSYFYQGKVRPSAG